MMLMMVIIDCLLQYMIWWKYVDNDYDNSGRDDNGDGGDMTKTLLMTTAKYNHDIHIMITFIAIEW